MLIYSDFRKAFFKTPSALPKPRYLFKICSRALSVQLWLYLGFEVYSKIREGVNKKTKFCPQGYRNICLTYVFPTIFYMNIKTETAISDDLNTFKTRKKVSYFFCKKNKTHKRCRTFLIA